MTEKERIDILLDLVRAAILVYDHDPRLMSIQRRLLKRRLDAAC